MIQRIVKLAIDPNQPTGDVFRKIFSESKALIAQQPGCRGVYLLESKNHFFTLSYWDSEADLNDYRASPLFQSVWPKTKPLFYEKPEAWTCQTVDNYKA